MSAMDMVPWTQKEITSLPKDAKPLAIVKHANQLSSRDKKALVAALKTKSYEMATSFVWAKAIATLKKQLSKLGMEFVGEMLGRTDLNNTSNPLTDIREDEAIELAEQLGMINTTEAIRLKNCQTLVNHFLDPDTPHNEQMYRDEAVSIVRSCVVNFLSEPDAKSTEPFLKLRQKLESETLDPAGPEAEALAASPYFYIRTTLTVLLTQLKIADGAKLEHAAGNIGTLLPVMWPKLRENDRWQTGESYALLQSANRPKAAAGMRSALLNVKGFDYVPENLRSETFRSAARAVLNAHFGYSNFHNEPKPMETLLRLGSSVPGPAVAECFSSALCVRLGNRYGHSFDAQPYVDKFLKLFRQSQWKYYLNKLLPSDTHILEKLAFENKPLERWIAMVEEFKLESHVKEAISQKLVSSDKAKRGVISKAALHRRNSVMKET